MKDNITWIESEKHCRWKDVELSEENCLKLFGYKHTGLYEVFDGLYINDAYSILYYEDCNSILKYIEQILTDNIETIKTSYSFFSNGEQIILFNKIKYKIMGFKAEPFDKIKDVNFEVLKEIQNDLLNHYKNYHESISSNN